MIPGKRRAAVMSFSVAIFGALMLQSVSSQNVTHKTKPKVSLTSVASFGRVQYQRRFQGQRRWFSTFYTSALGEVAGYVSQQSYVKS
ncbi:hypothetical protein E3U43_004465 [Larimichthys crocea]|uniref:Uncharacterized protein n=1 Tax=Larimichthys crocea TaxID=215358 RepID=A0ACD3QDE1_LARCR|nr:hypothetical protein E3U43_004465 [Larimichthys crocea]